MFRVFSSRLKRGWWRIVIVGLVSFVASLGTLIVFAAGWVATVVPTVSETVLATVLAAVVAQFAMSLTHAVLTRHQSREIAQMRTAIDSMAQGLCMFDASERLSAQTVLAASKSVEEETTNLRSEVESFLTKVAV